MPDTLAGRLCNAGFYVIAGAIAIGAFGHCLLGTCPAGAGAAQAASTTRAAGPAAQAPGPPQAPAAKAKVVSQNFAIDGMFCSGCAIHIMTEVRKVPGVRSVDVDLGTGKGTISYEAGKVNAGVLIKAIQQAGYQARVAG